MSKYDAKIRVFPIGVPPYDETISWNTTKTYDGQLARYFGIGAYVEHVTVKHPTTGKAADMFVNENGHMIGLPQNLNIPRSLYPGVIVGPAVLFLNRKVWL